MRTVAVWACVGWFAACDSPGGRSQALVPVDGSDAADSDAPLFEVSDGDASDTGEPGDTGDTGDATAVETVDTALPETVDTAVPETDTTSPETVACGDECLPVSTEGAPTSVVFRQLGTTPRPSLRGGAAPSGDWDLGVVTVYTSGTFAEGIDVQFGNHGQTAGRITFTAEALAMALDLDLDVTVTAFGSSGQDTAKSLVTLGGCHEVAGAQLVGDFRDCTAGSASQGRIDFELDGGNLDIGVEISREALIALLPPDQQSAGELAILGPMYLVASFTR